jgi:hypothetical protein
VLQGLRRLVSHPIRVNYAQRGEPESAADTGQANVGSFVSPDSLATFPGATVGVTVVWGIIDRFMPHQAWVGAVLCALTGLGLFLLDQTDRNAGPTPPRPRFVLRLFAAVVNTCVLFGAVSSAMTLANVPAPHVGAP